MEKIFLLLMLAITLFACKKNNDGFDQRLQLTLESCVLDNAHSYAGVKKLKGAGSLSATSSDTGIAEIRFDEKDKNVFYIIGHGQGNATITVVDDEDNTTGDDWAMKTIDVEVREPISYGAYSHQDVYMKKGEFRIFKLPFSFDKNDSLVGVNDYIVSVQARVSLGNQFKAEAISNGITEFQIYKGRIEHFSLRIHVVNEYDLLIQERDRELTFDLPFTYGVNGIHVWRGSGRYSAKVVDETVAVVESIILDNHDWANEMNNSAAVRVTPLKSGKTKLIVTDVVTGQTASVDVVVN